MFWKIIWKFFNFENFPNGWELKGLNGQIWDDRKMAENSAALNEMNKICKKKGKM